ncbi:MAG TPA: DUF2318 domain-containing protein [Deltaproteobacteria bacterium]|nr:DUF2318 domain-containing protein [Deltaproteobacteria bacterium]
MARNAGSEEYDDPVVSSGQTMSEYEYAVNLFDDGKPHYYQLDTSDGITVRYYIMKSSDGVIRSAFDACDVCWPEGKGYVQDGDTMVCRNCGRAFPSTQINEVKGGCNPAPLRRTVADGKVVLLRDDILKGSSYFNVPAGR